MTQLGDDEILEDIFSNLEVLHSSFPDVVRYLQSLRALSNHTAKRLGTKFWDYCRLHHRRNAYHRMWALTLFTESTEWDNEDAFLNLLNLLPDPFSRRKLILALGGRARGLVPVPLACIVRGAALVTTSFDSGCKLHATDARRHWYDAIEPRLDILEKAVVKWARTKPIAAP